MEKASVVWGFTTFYSETGTEGGYWAVQDIRGVDVESRSDRRVNPYYGLLLLENGDRLTIYERESLRPEGGLIPWEEKVVWDGQIQLRTYPPFTLSARGLWIHQEQEGVDLDWWAGLFFGEYPCRLVTRRVPWRVAEVELSAEAIDGILIPNPRLVLYSDGSLGWNLENARVYPEIPPVALRKFFHDRSKGQG